MGETCLHVPARVFGFKSTLSISGQPQKSPGTVRASLLSQLLKGSHPQLPSALMDTSDVYSEDDDDDMEDPEVEDHSEEAEEVEDSAAGGSTSAPVPIPSTSDAFLKAQHEALKRFVYAHQIEEMRRQCAEYFERQARFQEVSASEISHVVNATAPTAPVEEAVTIPTSRHRLPGF